MCDNDNECSIIFSNNFLALLTFTGCRWFKCPQLFLLQAGAVCVQLVSECLGCHVFVCGVYKTDRPPSFLLILRQDVTIQIVRISIHHHLATVVGWSPAKILTKRIWLIFINTLVDLSMKSHRVCDLNQLRNLFDILINFNLILATFIQGDVGNSLNHIHTENDCFKITTFETLRCEMWSREWRASLKEFARGCVQEVCRWKRLKKLDILLLLRRALRVESC